jgi:hypothetical protein
VILPMSQMNAESCAPNFLIVSPPRTASTWLATHLNDHPRVFIPRAKELHYFNYFYRYFDLPWYLSHFAAGADRVRGEATPMPALDVERMREIRALCPDIRLIFMIREPCAHAWSVLRHSFATEPATFGGQASLSDVPEDVLIRKLSSVVAVASTDFEWSISQWLSVFDVSQLYVDFYAQVRRNPLQLLANVLRHIGIAADVPRCASTLAQVVNGNAMLSRPHRIKQFLEALYVPKAKSLSRFLKRQFGLTCPPEWDRVLHAARPVPFTIRGESGSMRISVVEGQFHASRSVEGREQVVWTADDLDTLDIALASNTPPMRRADALAAEAERQVAPAFRGRECVAFGTPPGHTLVHTQKRFFAIDKNVPITAATREQDLERYIADGQAVEGRNLEELYLACTPTVVLESASGWNVVAFRTRYYAISQALGPVDLANVSSEWIKSQIRAGLLVVVDTLDHATVLAAITFPAPAEPRVSAPPRLVESVGKYNIVSYANRFFGVPQSAGPIEVDASDMTSVPGVIVDDALDKVRARIRKQTGE